MSNLERLEAGFAKYHFLRKDKLFVTFFWNVLHKYFFLKLNVLKSYRLDLIPNNPYFYNVIRINKQKSTV